ncbi:MAG TPA: VWA domain-containing protein [Bryobacteraceae bacterium]|nr:VWA domain-containing protein [Bryobacteraceae bacterium]
MRPILLFTALCLSAQETVIRTAVPLILIPTTVADRHGRPIEGLVREDFEVLDNGNPVTHTLEITNQPVALIVAIETSVIAGPALAKIQKIGPLFEPLVVGHGGVASILTYSDHIKVLQPFTSNGDTFTRSIRKILPDGAAAHLNDAVLEAVAMFSHPGFRRVLIIIGESRDRGSHASLQDAISRAQAANVTVYPVNYSVYKTSFTSRGDERFAGTNRRVCEATGNMDLLAVFTEIARLGTGNAGEALAKYTGGQKVSFSKLAGLEHVISIVGEDLHSQYLLSFVAASSDDNTYHPITITVKRPDVVVRARPGYWRNQDFDRLEGFVQRLSREQVHATTVAFVRMPGKRDCRRVYVPL